MSNYTRLRQVLELHPEGFDDSKMYTSLLQRIRRCRELAASYRTNPGMTGKTGDAATQWLSDCDTTLETLEARLRGAQEANEAAVVVVSQAKSEGNRLSPVLMSPWERTVLQAEPEVWVDGMCLTGAAYASWLQAKREREREEAAAQILRSMNTQLKSIDFLEVRDEQKKPVPDPSKDNAPGATGAAGAGAAGGSSRSSQPHATPSRGASAGMVSATLGLGAAIGGGSLTGAGSSGSNWVSRVPTSGAGSRGNPITDPSALNHLDPSKTPVNPRMTPDGPQGGYLPAPVTDRDDPRWSANYSAPGFSSTGSRAGLAAGGLMAGGMLVGAGRAVAAHTMPNAFPAGFALNGQAAAGMGGRVPAGGMLRPSGISGSPLSSGTAGSMAGSPGAPQNAAGAAASQNSQASNSGMRRPTSGMPASGSHSGEDEEEDGTARHGYQVFRLDDETPEDPYHHALMEAGTIADLAPADTDEDDEW